jgi:hypothetical protein
LLRPRPHNHPMLPASLSTKAFTQGSQRRGYPIPLPLLFGSNGSGPGATRLCPFAPPLASRPDARSTRGELPRCAHTLVRGGSPSAPRAGFSQGWNTAFSRSVLALA